jgi:hypothetical protein
MIPPCVFYFLMLIRAIKNLVSKWCFYHFVQITDLLIIKTVLQMVKLLLRKFGRSPGNIRIYI